MLNNVGYTNNLTQQSKSDVVVAGLTANQYITSSWATKVERVDGITVIPDKLLKKCAEFFMTHGRLMKAVKSFRLPCRRFIFNLVKGYIPVTKKPELVEVSKPCEIKIYKPVSAPFKDKLIREILKLGTQRKSSRCAVNGIVECPLILVNPDKETYEIDAHPYRESRRAPDLVVKIGTWGRPILIYDLIDLCDWVRDLTTEGIEPNPGPRNARTKATNNRKKRNGRKKPANSRGQRSEHPGLVMPPRHLATFKYVDSSYVRNNPGNNYLVYSFRINDLYDPDPLILSGSISGFKEMMQFYAYYRVIKFSANINISNNEVFDLLYGAVFSQTNLTGVISSRDDAINALENNYCKGPFLLSEKGGMDRGTMVLRINPANLLGVPRQYFGTNDYAGSGLATPPIPLWLNFIVCTPTGAAMANGYTTTTKFFFDGNA